MASAAPAVVLPFPLRGKRDAAQSATEVSHPAPAVAERPTHFHPELRDWLKIALIGSLIVHLGAVAIFHLRFESDLERAAGAAASAASDGAVTIPIEIVVESTLPSAPSPTNASSADAKTPEPVEEQKQSEAQKEPQTVKVEDLMPPPPEPAQVVLPTAQSLVQLPPSPEPAPVILPSQSQAQRLALPVEETAPRLPAETAKTPEVPTQPAATVVQEKPLPVTRPPAPTKQVQEKPQERKAARSAPSAAASPSKSAASASAQSSAGAGGQLDAGGRAAISSYQAQVLAHLQRHRVYPPEARSRGATGVARVRFALGRNGQVLSVSLAGGSGEQILDQAALDMVRRASPFPPFPEGISQARMDFGAPIRFDLR